MKRRIKKVTVIGSGIMGSGIACHLAGIGVEVLLLDIAPKKLTEEELKSGFELDHPNVLNRIAQTNLQLALKSKPAVIYSKKFTNRISVGNLTTDLPKIKDSDWIIEVVVEKLDIKQSVFEKVEKYRVPGTLISSNTSGIPIHLMAQGRSEDFKKHFCGTHFFNPARYLKLLEIIPSPHTSPQVLDFFMDYGEKFLGKTSVLCKDTPAFIANRIGMFSMMNLLHQLDKMNLSIEEVDKLTGTVIGRPKSATFRTIDLVGLDTLVHVANGLHKGCPNDEANHLFTIPEYIKKLLKNKWLGAKSGQGFYKKIKNEEGKSKILTLDLKTMKYREKQKASLPTLEMTKSIDELSKRYSVLIEGKDKAAKFYRKNFAGLFAYVSNRIPEITDDFYKIDNALRAGFGWEHGPFQLWDAVGISKGLDLIKAEGLQAADWVKKIISSNIASFYSISDKGIKEYYSIRDKKYVPIPGQSKTIILNNIRKNKTIWSNSESSIQDLGDGILNFEFRSKMNTLGSEVIQGLNKAIDIAENKYDGLVIGNQAANFSVGANIAMIFMLAVEQEFDELNFAVKSFQQSMMRVRYSSIPVIVAPHGMTLGGGCELSLHADSVVAAAESYMGLVEFGVGVIPAGGGTKEFTKRTACDFHKGDLELNRLQECFMTIATAKVSTSAHEAMDLYILQKYKDIIVANKDRQIAIAKRQAQFLADNGYIKPIPKKDIKVLGKQALGAFIVGVDSMKVGGYISDHDKKIALKLANVMAGGDLSEASFVSEQYLLDLEREAFLSLCGEKKTLERIQHMLQRGKPLRN